MEWDKVFTAGWHTDSNGNRKLWTVDDLDRIVNSFNPSFHEPPLVIGHPSDNAPAFGWVAGIKRIGADLYLQYKDVAAEFKEWTRKKLYKKKSIAVYPDGSLRHVGYLGAMPPAIKGLPDFAFKDVQGEAAVYEFCETPSLLGRLQNLFMEAMNAVSKGGEAMEVKKRAQFCADCGNHCCMTACPTDAISMTADKGAVIDPAKCTICMACCQACCMMNDPVCGMQVANYKEKESDMKVEEVQALIDKALQGQETKFSEQLKGIAESIKGLGTQFGEFQKMATADREAGLRREFAEFLNAPEMQRRIPEGSREATISHMMTLVNAAPVEFGEGDQKKSIPAVEAYKTQLKVLPPVVEFSEVATKDRGGKVEQKSATRKEFDTWTPAKQSEFSCNGGVIVD